MIHNPLVTIITPTYNRAHLLPNVIKSVLNQTYPNWEYLIVDDASTDETAEVVQNIDDERIKYIPCPVNGGNAQARNVGVNAAKGEFIAFIDSDDDYHTDYLEKALNLLTSSPENIGFLYSGTRTVNLEGKSSEFIWIPNTENHSSQFLYQLKVGIGRGFLFRRECFSHLRFDENLRTAVDTDFLIRLRQEFNFTILKEIVVNINTQPGSVRTNYSEKKKSYNIIIQKHSDIINNDSFLVYKWYYKLFWLALYDNDKKLAGKAFSKIWYKSFKPSILFLIFSLFKKEKAIRIHRKYS